MTSASLHVDGEVLEWAACEAFAAAPLLLCETCFERHVVCVTGDCEAQQVCESLEVRGGAHYAGVAARFCPGVLVPSPRPEYWPWGGFSPAGLVPMDMGIVRRTRFLDDSGKSIFQVRDGAYDQDVPSSLAGMARAHDGPVALVDTASGFLSRRLTGRLTQEMPRLAAICLNGASFAKYAGVGVLCLGPETSDSLRGAQHPREACLELLHSLGCDRLVCLCGSGLACVVTHAGICSASGLSRTACDADAVFAFLLASFLAWHAGIAPDVSMHVAHRASQRALCA